MPTRKSKVRPTILKDLKPEHETILTDAFKKNIITEFERKIDAMRSASCSCSGCSCPPGGGDICDAGTYAGYAGGNYGSMSV